jgi:hypothetical protein
MAPLEEQFVIHRNLTDLGAQAVDLVIAVVGGPALDRRLAAGQELLPPVSHRRRGHPARAREAVERLTTQQPENHLGLAARREPPRLTPSVGIRWRRQPPE